MISQSDVIPTNVVVAFPVRQNAPNVRLANALAGLNTALDDQRSALADLRGALVDLHAAVGSLGSSFQTYAGRLGDLKQGVTTLRGKLESAPLPG